MYSYVGYRSIDPGELETRLSTEDGVCWLDFLSDEDPSEESQEKLDRILDILDMIPPIEADFVELYYYRKLRQTDIAELFCVSQPTVCYRLQRAADRIQFLFSMPDTTRNEIESSMREFLTEEIDVKIMVEMFDTTCQSEVAKRLNVSQGLVRHRFIRAIEKMCDAKRYFEGKRYKVYIDVRQDYEYFEELSDAQAMVVRERSRLAKNASKASKEPRIIQIQKLNKSVGRFYDVYSSIADNLNILRDVRRKSPDDDILRIVK